jgi:hypothetical protein
MIAGGAAIVVLAAGCSGSAGTTSTSVRPTTVAATTATSSVPATTTTLMTTTTSTAPPATTISAADPPPWDAWTLVYASLDTSLHAKEHAEAIASEMIEGASVLLSDDCPSLNPGYWVVYGGRSGNRRQAGLGCPDDLDPSLSCYPRYLGDRPSSLLAAGAAVAQLDQRLVVLDPASGEVLATLSDDFHNEGEFPGSFTLNRLESELYFGLGFEDSWYFCESEKGEVRRLDLDAGTEDVFADGWSPAVSPDGRWLAIIAARDCYPDPEVDGWVVAPGSQIEIYDLAYDGFAPSHVLRVEEAAKSYESADQVVAVLWDGDSEYLLIELSDGTMRRVARGDDGWLNDAPVAFDTGDPFLVAVADGALYFLTYYEELFLLTVVDRASDEVLEMREIPGNWASIAADEDEAVLIGGDRILILPSGGEVPLDGIVVNLAW